MRRLLVAASLASIIAAAAATIAFAATRRVALHDNFFSRTSLTIRRGDAVNWRWSTHNRHNVTAIRGARFHSGTSRTGNFTFRFRRRGRVTIICTRHPAQMRMTVRVI